MAISIMKRFRFTDGVLIAALLLVGSFHEYISCALAVAMSVYLLMRLGKNAQLRIRKDLLALAVLAICAGYGLSCFWAVDSGMAVIGFLKFLPLGLYLLCLWQEEGEGCVLQLLPYIGAAMAVISAVGMQFEAGKSLFSVADRLAGFFQYPNTFALFLLVCELVLLKKTGKKIWDYAVIVVLIAGLLYTGSRTVFVVFALANVAMLLAVSKKKARAVLLLLLGAAVLVVCILALSGNAVVRRYLTISLTESTFVGRILYWVDALPLLLKHPFGMGYMGYYYMQTGVQTGVYSVVYAHNDFLQLLLDVGWVPGGLFLAGLALWFCKKDVCLADKIIVGAICLHSLFDFDLQFVGIFLLLLLLTDRKAAYHTFKCKHPVPGQAGLVVVTIAGLYLGVALMVGHLGQNALSDFLYPFNTRNTLTILEQTEDLEEANALADKILKQNEACYVPYSIKAKYSYSQGDFGALIEYKHQVFAKNPFDHSEYEEYCGMLINGIMLYENAGDTQSAQVCRAELIQTQQLLRKNAQRLSKLGSMIADQPITELSEDMQAYIQQLEG